MVINAKGWDQMSVPSKERAGRKDPDWQEHIAKSQEAIDKILGQENVNQEDPEINRTLHVALLALRGTPSEPRFHQFDPDQIGKIIGRVAQSGVGVGDSFLSAIALSIDPKFTTPEIRKVLVANIVASNNAYNAWRACLEGVGLDLEQKKELAGVVSKHGSERDQDQIDFIRRQQGW